MIWMLFLFFAILISVVVICIQIRNDRVYKFRMKLLGQISEANLKEIDSHQYDLWSLRFEILELVPYGKMVREFWRPMESFWTSDQYERMMNPAITKELETE